ncbi:MAG: hypothetical protein H0X62_08550 [Bacteroidetes bacterium]|nr:hypothetical protein [Bacteroidota bacterium]
MKKLLTLILIVSAMPVFSQMRSDSTMQFWRPYDKRGINVFETGKQDTVPYDGLKVRIGGNFTQQFQAIDHNNDAVPVLNQDGRDINQLMNIGPGFNTATANLNLDVQLTDGIRMNMITYLSSRHHPDAWVKSGYLQVDKLPFFNNQFIDNAMEYLTFRVGHMEINYGDAHFRRSDNGNAFYNPFVGNYIMDAFTTEIGGEVYFQSRGFIAMAAMTGGEIQGTVMRPDDRAPSFYGKLGYDGQVTDNLRLRLTGSAYHTDRSLNNTLYAGDRAGSRYYMAMENQMASPAANFTSGRINPVMNSQITAFVINPFVKFHGLELFGNLEQSTGRTAAETESRSWTQIGADLLYRFGNNENFYVAARYNTVSGELVGTRDNVTIERIQAGMGWFVTKNILAKVEYVNQQYNGYRNTNILHGGRFNGVMIEGAVAF